MGGDQEELEQEAAEAELTVADCEAILGLGTHPVCSVMDSFSVMATCYVMDSCPVMAPPLQWPSAVLLVLVNPVTGLSECPADSSPPAAELAFLQSSLTDNHMEGHMEGNMEARSIEPVAEAKAAPMPQHAESSAPNVPVLAALLDMRAQLRVVQMGGSIPPQPPSSMQPVALPSSSDSSPARHDQPGTSERAAAHSASPAASGQGPSWSDLSSPPDSPYKPCPLQAAASESPPGITSGEAWSYKTHHHLSHSF